MSVVTIDKECSGRIIVTFPFNLLLIAKVKNIEGHKLYPIENVGALPIQIAR